MEAKTSSNFLNQLEKPLDICRVADAAGAPYVGRVMANSKDLPDQIATAVSYASFSLMDIWGICPGRYLKRNRITLAELEKEMDRIALSQGVIVLNEREEYAAHYRRLAAEKVPVGEFLWVAATIDAPFTDGRCEVLIIGAAGQYINTAGEVLCLAAMSDGLHVTQKNDYPITVLRGHSVCEVALDRKPVGYTGISKPSVILCLAPEGIAKRKDIIFRVLESDSLVIKGNDLVLPETKAEVIDIDFASLKIKPSQRVLAALAVLSGVGHFLNKEMLLAGINHRYRGKMLENAKEIVEKISNCIVHYSIFSMRS
jgi:Pyruvate/2-oxoacid:ferredoxin oxidoreductase gamma subunit